MASMQGRYTSVTLPPGSDEDLAILDSPNPTTRIHVITKSDPKMFSILLAKAMENGWAARHFSTHDANGRHVYSAILVNEPTQPKT